MSIGDVLGPVMALLALSLSGWALTLLADSFFPYRIQRANEAVSVRTNSTLAMGAIVLLIVGTIALMLVSSKVPLLVLFGLLLTSVVLAIAVIGLSGTARLIATRLRSMDNAMSEYGSLSRASAILFASALMPFVGWFIVAPLLLCMGLGAGLKSFGTAHEVSKLEA
ncbi:MAG: hypothetical protein JSS72_04530 [Armatimonadetes bacterium]|nr:hypothetical protein [Armatimonadota bacterium]